MLKSLYYESHRGLSGSPYGCLGTGRCCGDGQDLKLKFSQPETGPSAARFEAICFTCTCTPGILAAPVKANEIKGVAPCRIPAPGLCLHACHRRRLRLCRLRVRLLVLTWPLLWPFFWAALLFGVKKGGNTRGSRRTVKTGERKDTKPNKRQKRTAFHITRMQLGLI